jgi:hypothetical protein
LYQNFGREGLLPAQSLHYVAQGPAAGLCHTGRIQVKGPHQGLGHVGEPAGEGQAVGCVAGQLVGCLSRLLSNLQQYSFAIASQDHDGFDHLGILR